MKNPLEITQDVLNGMIGIGGIPTNQEFYDEFNDRLKAALSLHNVSDCDHWTCEKCGKVPNEQFTYEETHDGCGGHCS